MTVLFRLSCSSCPSNCPLLAVLDWLSFTGYILQWQPCQGSLVLPVPNSGSSKFWLLQILDVPYSGCSKFWLFQILAFSNSDCPILVVLSLLFIYAERTSAKVRAPKYERKKQETQKIKNWGAQKHKGENAKEKA
jgi:hypothetical protein